MINTKLKCSNFETRKKFRLVERKRIGGFLTRTRSKETTKHNKAVKTYKSATHRMKRKTVGGCIKKMRVIVIDVKPLARTGRVGWIS